MLAGEPGCRIAGAADTLGLGLGQRALGEIRQFEIVEEEVEELLARQHEAERILAVALARSARPSAALFRRPRNMIAFAELLVAGQHHVPRAAAALKRRLVQPVERNFDLAAFKNITDVLGLGRFLHRALHQCLGAAKKFLAVLEALASGIEASIDDLHCRPCSICSVQICAQVCPLLRQLACFTRMYHSTSRRTWRSV